MTRYLLDTNHASAVFKRQLDINAHPKRRPDDQFGFSLPSIGELWFMVFNSGRIDRNITRLREVLTDFKAWPFDDDAAIEFGHINVECRRAGRPLAGIDCQIAAIARVNNLTLLTDDKDFTSVQGLNLDNWIR